ncbi:hypothetical protein BMETH_735_2 [methanotrophic bacterial endosymbiont of Bathymodiolus sp.]|nr:hypothetical protein BMETH_735_2 [methanotrophic bacterial endosymbiont of Bathymodiolus sp.]
MAVPTVPSKNIMQRLKIKIQNIEPSTSKINKKFNGEL